MSIPSSVENLVKFYDHCPISNYSQPNIGAHPILECLIDFDEKFAQQMNWICIICADLLREPVETHCGHLYCKSCITQVLRYKQQCPICRQQLLLDKLRFSAAIERQINNAKIHCIHRDLESIGLGGNNSGKNNSCNWTGSISQLKAHLYNNCEYQKTKCCGTWFNRESFQKHFEGHQKELFKYDEIFINNYLELNLQWKLFLSRHYRARGQYEKILYLVKPLAELGIPEAMVEIAILYEKGIPDVLPKDFKISFELFQAAALKKNHHAMYKVASYYITGDYCPQNIGLGLDLLHELISQKYPAAYWSMGEIYFKGLYGISKNIDYAYEAFSFAVKNAIGSTEYKFLSLKRLITIHENKLTNYVMGLSEEENKRIITQLSGELRIVHFTMREIINN